MNPVLVTPDALPSVWAFVVRALNAVRRKTGEQYEEAHVLTELRERRAFLWLDRANDPRMLGILQPVNGELHVWVAANFGPKYLLWEALAWAKDQREQHGFARITFDSARKGWARHFRVTKYTYEV